MRALVCAATRAEHDACRRGILASRTGVPSAYEMLLTGVGPVRAARSLARRLARGGVPDLVVSSGFAGACADPFPAAITGAVKRVVSMINVPSRGFMDAPPRG